MLSNRIAQLAPPPRPVPLQVVCSALLGVIGGFGAVFLIFGMIFAVIFGGGFSPVDELRLALSTETTRGTVTAVIATGATENEVTVYKYEFAFTASDGREVRGESYATGRTWSEGDRVQVRYAPDKPTAARMEGARRSLFSPWVLLAVLIFPTVGAAMFGVATVRGLRHVALLRHGEITGARILSQNATGVSVNNTPVIEYAYEFEAHDGETYLGSCRSLPRSSIGDEVKEPVLYLPSNPDRSVLVDALPLRYPLDVDGFGQWATDGSRWSVARYALIWAGIITVAIVGLVRVFSIF